MKPLSAHVAVLGVSNLNNDKHEACQGTNSDEDLDFLSIMAEFSDNIEDSSENSSQFSFPEEEPSIEDTPDSEPLENWDQFNTLEENIDLSEVELPQDIFDDAFFASIANEEPDYREPSVALSSEAEPEEGVIPRLPMKDKENTDNQPKKEKQDSPQKTILLYLHDLVYLLCAILLVFLLLFRVVVVSGDSMNQTLINGDYLLLVSNIFYQNPKQGDIIVASKKDFQDGVPIVKRVIATEGQRVDIDFTQGVVYVDGVALEESYVYTSTTNFEGVQFPLTVDEGCVFVLGDNRMVSKDSRHPEIGLIDTREILGKAFFLFLPGAEDGKNPDFSRFGALS